MSAGEKPLLFPGACIAAVFDSAEAKALCIASLMLGSPMPTAEPWTAIARLGPFGYVSAGITLMSGFSVAENLSMPLAYHRSGRRNELMALAERLCRHAGVDSALLSASCDELSPLERVQATLLQAAVAEPEVLLLDAVFDGLSPQQQQTFATNLQGYRRLMPLRRMIHLGYALPPQHLVPLDRCLTAQGVEECPA